MIYPFDHLRFRELKRRTGLSISEMATIWGVSPETVKKWMKRPEQPNAIKDWSNVPVDKRRRLLAALNEARKWDGEPPYPDRVPASMRPPDSSNGA